MPYNIAERFDRLRTRMKGLNQNSLTYTRSGTTVTIQNFTPEKVDVNQLALFGVTLITEKMQDFVFDTASLSSFSPGLPQVADEIIWTDGLGNKNTYHVMSVGTEVFTYTTSSRRAIRVHTKQVS